MRVPLLDLTREYALVGDEIRRAWGDALQAMQLLKGENVARFEAEIAAYVGVPHACGVSSGTDALLLGMAALGIGPGDRVVIPANAFIAALEAIHHLGAQPALVDATADGFGPDVDAVAAALPAKAIIVVHLYGAALDLAPLRRLCARHGTLLVEDASHAHGARRGTQRVGSFGAVGCFSAGIVKNLAAYGDAGFVTTADANVAREVGLLQRHGQERKNHHLRYGLNARLDELQAAVLRIKLRHLDARNERRRAIAAFYNERFRGLDLRLPHEEPDEYAVYHQYVIRSTVRERLQTHLHKEGIETGIHYPVPLHRQPAWLRTYGEAPPYPRAERLAREILSLPVFPELTDGEVERVADAVVSFFSPRMYRGVRVQVPPRSAIEPAAK